MKKSARDMFYELSVVTLQPDDTALNAEYSLLLTIHKTLVAAPMTVRNGRPTVRMWRDKRAVKDIMEATQRAIAKANTKPDGNVKGFVVSYKSGNKPRYLGFVELKPHIHDDIDTDADTLRWGQIDTKAPPENCFVTYGMSKAAQGQASELMDGLSAYSINWTQTRITPSELG